MQAASGPYFDDFHIGESITTEGRTVTRADVLNFAGVSGDFAPLHLDEEFGKTTIFGKNIAHGLCVMSIASGKIVATGILSNLMAFYGMDEWQFRNPLFFGDTIRVRITVDSKKESKKPGRGIVCLKMEILNQKDDIVQQGKWTVMIERKV